MAKHSKAKKCKAKQCKAKQSKARQSEAKQSKAKQGGKTGRDKSHMGDGKRCRDSLLPCMMTSKYQGNELACAAAPRAPIACASASTDALSLRNPC